MIQWSLVDSPIGKMRLFQPPAFSWSARRSLSETASQSLMPTVMGRSRHCFVSASASDSVYQWISMSILVLLFKGLRLTAGRRPSNDFWLMVWEDWAEQTQGGLCWTEAGIMRSACLYGSSLGLCWAQVVPMFGQVGPMLSHLAPILGLCWAKSGPCWAGPILGLHWPRLGLCWAMLGPSWTHVGPIMAYVGPCWAVLGAMLGPCLGHLCWNDLKMPFCLPRTPSWSPKPHKKKNDVFQHRQDEISCRWRARNTVSKIHHKLQWLSTVNRGWVGGGEGSAYNLRLPPKASGKRPDVKAYAWQPGAGQATTFGLWCGKIGPRFSAQTQRGLCWTEAGIMRSACLYGSSLGLCWAQVVPMFGQVGNMLSHLAPILGLCCTKSGPSWAYVGPSRAHVELGPSWAYIGPCWAYNGLCWPMLGLCWPMLSPLSSDVGAMFGPSMLKRS